MMKALFECADHSEKLLLQKVLDKYLADQNSGARSERHR
jgi:hypothetical protein